MNKRKEVFTALGTIDKVGEDNKLRLKSPRHWQHWVNKLFPGKDYAIVVYEHQTARSDAQIKYYWVLLGYLGEYTGYEPEELHDAIMRQKFGVKRIKIGDIEQEVRRSIANRARFPKSDMVELIDTVLGLCRKLGVAVPSLQELGYLPNQ